MKKIVAPLLCLSLLTGCHVSSEPQSSDISTAQSASCEEESVPETTAPVTEQIQLSAETPQGYKYGELIISEELEYSLAHQSLCIDDVWITAQRKDGQDYSAQAILDDCIAQYDSVGCTIVHSELKPLSIGGIEVEAACVTANINIVDETILSYTECAALETEHYVYIFNYGYWGENVPDISHVYDGISLLPYSDDYFKFDDDYSDLLSDSDEEPRTLFFDGGLSFDVPSNTVLEYASDNSKQYSFNGSYEYLEVEIFKGCSKDTVRQFNDLDLLLFYSDHEKWSDMRRINVNGIDIVYFISNGQRCFLLQNNDICYCIKMRMFHYMMLDTLAFADFDGYQFNDSIDDLVIFVDYPEESYEYFNGKIGVSCPAQFEFSLSNNTLYCNEWGGRYRTARCLITATEVKDFYHMDIADFKRYYSTCTALRRTNIDGYDTILLEFHTDTIYSLEALVRINDNEYYSVYTEYYKNEYQEYVDTWGENAILADDFLGNAQRFIGSIRIKD